MKKIIVGLLFNALIALNAGILSDDPRLYRSLSSVEYAVFGTPDPKLDPKKAIKRICYVEVRHAANLQAASSEDDEFLNEFEKVFDDCYTPETVDYTPNYTPKTVDYTPNYTPKTVDYTPNYTPKTVGGIAAEIKGEKSIVKIGILIWFIRKAIDEIKAIEDIEAITQYNMLSFYRSYPIILKTIMAAITKGGAKVADNYEDNPEHLQYPALIKGILSETVPWYTPQTQ